MNSNTLYLLRHAHADYLPDENRPLSVRGIEESFSVADILSQYPIQAIYTSPARRATQTVEPLAERLGLPLIAEPDLQERRLCRGTVEDFFKAVEKTWLDPSFAHPGGETNMLAQQRGLGVIQRIAVSHASAHIVLSTHGNLLALILKVFDPAVDFAFWKSLTMPDIFRIDRDPSGGVRIRRLWRDAMAA